MAKVPWFQLDMAVQPVWEHVDLIRESLVRHLRTVFGDSDYCVALTMVVSELLENAIKHGDWNRFAEALLKLKISSDAKAGSMVEVASPCTPDSAEAREILQAVSDLAAGSSAEILYKRRLTAVAQTDDGDEDRVLGLLRIGYETGCFLQASIDAENYLHISAMIAAPRAVEAQTA